MKKKCRNCPKEPVRSEPNSCGSGQKYKRCRGSLNRRQLVPPSSIGYSPDRRLNGCARIFQVKTAIFPFLAQ